MEKILILVDHYPLSPRVIKIKNTLESKDNTSVTVFAWNRNNVNIKENFVYSYNDRSGYGNLLKSVKNMKHFLYYADIFIREFRPDILHIIDYSALQVLNNNYKNMKIVYEVYDIKFFKYRALNIYRHFTEKRIIKQHVDFIILASPFFKDYYQNILKISKPCIVINNKPNSNYLRFQKKNRILTQYENLFSQKKVISFIGTVRYKEILINLFEACRDINEILILIAGEGPDLNELKSYVDENNLESKVIFIDRFDISEIEHIYFVTDFVWAVYPNKDKNVKYAISNKYFESQLFKKPIIVSNNTLLGDDIDKDIGEAIDPYDRNAIKKLLLNLDSSKFHNKKVHQDNLWWEKEVQNIFSTYPHS